MLTDSLGLLLEVSVTPTDVHDSKAAPDLMGKSCEDLVVLKDQPVAVRLCGRTQCRSNPRIGSNPYTTSQDATGSAPARPHCRWGPTTLVGSLRTGAHQGFFRDFQLCPRDFPGIFR